MRRPLSGGYEGVAARRSWGKQVTDTEALFEGFREEMVEIDPEKKFVGRRTKQLP